MIVAPLLLAAFLSPASPQGNQKCVQDARTCLMRFFEMYLKALDIRKPEALPVAPDVKFTEDWKQLKFGEGLWTTVSRVCGYQLVATDVAEGVVAGHVVVEENGSPVLADIHLKVVNDKITEIETLVTHNQSPGPISCRR